MLKIKEWQKLLSTWQEIEARGASVLVITNDSGREHIPHHHANNVLSLPDTGEIGNLFAFSLALQLLAYHVTKKQGKNIDRPRNLAKSVTVE